MVLDTSACVAIALAEPEAEAFAGYIEAQSLRLISAVSWVALTIVIRQRLGDEAEARVVHELNGIGLEIVSVDVAQAQLARQAFALFGKGRHAARLNFGDCFAYALARARDLPLLFKGDDFTKTDVEAAIVARGR